MSHLGRELEAGGSPNLSPPGGLLTFILAALLVLIGVCPNPADCTYNDVKEAGNPGTSDCVVGVDQGCAVPRAIPEPSPLWLLLAGSVALIYELV